MKTRNVHATNQPNLMTLWNHRYLIILIFVATYISLGLFYGIRDDVNSFCLNIPRHKGSDFDRQFTTIPLFTTTYTRNHYHHYNKIPFHNGHSLSSLNDSQLNFKFCSDLDKCKFLFPYQPPPYENQKSNQIHFFTYTSLAQILNRTLVLPSNVDGDNGGESSKSYLFHSCGIIHKVPSTPGNEGGANEIDSDDNDEKEYNIAVLKKLFPKVRFVSQHEFRLWMNSRIRKPSMIHEFISVWGSRIQNVEVLDVNHQDFFIHEWLEKLDTYLFNDNHGMKNYKNFISRDGTNGREGVVFKKINLGLKSFSTKKLVKLATQFLLDELKKSDEEVLLLAHDLKFKEFSKAFSAIEDSEEHLSVEKIGEICKKMDL